MPLAWFASVNMTPSRRVLYPVCRLVVMGFFVDIIRRIGVDDVEAGLIAEVERELAATVGAAPASVER